jgi:hypothetical protein
MMANYSVWTVQELGSRIVEWRGRLQHAKTREQLLSIWGEIEVMGAEFNKAVFENRTERDA